MKVPSIRATSRRVKSALDLGGAMQSALDVGGRLDAW